MVFFLVALTLVIFNKMEFAKENDFFHNEYMNKSTTTAVNGIFVILIIFSHYSQYADFQGMYDVPYLALKEHLNQMVVATFLFYSGYGMMEAFKRKGRAYLKKIPSKFITLLVRFDIAVCLFGILGKLLSLGIDYNPKLIVLSLLAWLNLGNSNWYIFVILVLYICIYVSFQGLRYSEKPNVYFLSTVALSVLTAIFVFILMKQDLGMYWYDTAMLLPFVMFYSLGKDRIERIVMRSDAVFFAWCVLFSVIYVILYFHRFDYGIGGYTLWAMSFIVLVLLATMKIKIGNPVLEWFGKHIFSVYILQRIPMIILDHFGFVDDHRYMCLILVLIITALLVVVFEQFTDKIFSFFH